MKLAESIAEAQGKLICHKLCVLAFHKSHFKTPHAFIVARSAAHSAQSVLGFKQSTGVFSLCELVLGEDKGYAALSVAPRGKLRSNQQFNPGYPGLLTHNITDRNTYSYRGFYVDAGRAVDFLLGRPEVDAARIGVTGSSQGGALTITTSALRHEIACAAAGAPYLCGFMDSARLTHSYPYQEINDYLRLYPEREEQVRRTLEYFDGIGLTRRLGDVRVLRT